MVHNPILRVSRVALVALTWSAAVAAPLAAQAGRAGVRVQENLRAEPNGVVVAVLEPGMPLEVLREQGNWMEVVVEGWVWTQSLQARDGGAYDYRVGVPGGENLRDRPQGRVLARLEEGALLEGVDRAPGWVQVRRRAWIWKSSVTPVEPVAQGGSAGTPEDPPPTVTAAFRAGEASPVLASPDGDTLSVLRPGAELPVTARQGNWARVRLEGWVWLPGGEVAQGSAAPAESGVGLDEVARDPDAFVGRLVTWELQFVSLEAAESVRVDFYEGEPFLLTRPASEGTGRFVYVAIPPDQLQAARGLAPLERITVTGRIRTGASSLTGAPLLDLVEFRRRR